MGPAMETLKALKTILVGKSRTIVAADKSKPVGGNSRRAKQEGLATGASTVPISLRQLETIALSSVRLAAMGPRLAAVAGKMEKQADEQAKHAAQIAHDTDRLTARLNDALARLQDASVNVHSVVGDIARIAEQTRILSINASIEAGRAGEQGRAFNVVAQEVQQLASQTRESTGAIEAKVQAIQGSVRELASSVAVKNSTTATAGGEALVTVHTVNTEVQAMAATAGGQREDARSLHGLGDQANHLTEELLLAVGGFRLEVHRQAAKEIKEFLNVIAENFGTRRGLENKMLAWLQQHSGFELLYVTDPGGRQVVDNLGWKGDATVLDSSGFNRDWSDRPWYRNALRQPDDVAISDIYRSAATGNFCFTVSAIVHDQQGRAIGVLGADVNFQRLLTGDLRR